MRDMERLRAVNRWLRGEGPAPPDVTPEEAGAVRGPAQRVARQPSGAAPLPSMADAERPLSNEELDALWAAEVAASGAAQPSPPQPAEGGEVFGIGARKTTVPLGGGRKVEFKRIKGVDYERGVVQIDDYEYAITEEEKQAVASFAIQVMLRELNIAIAQLMSTSKAKLPGVPDGAVQQVPGGVGQPTQEPVPAVPDGVHEGVEPPGDPGQAAPPPESPRAGRAKGKGAGGAPGKP